MFRYESTTPHEDLHCTIVKYTHPSGMEHYHVTSPFPEMSFVLSLKTPPEDDTGTPHILEHLTLCGSQKFPFKDPFMAMQNRSVAHMMNAQTGPLTTSYHFKTTVEKDFFNLSDLYSDLVFNPLMRQSDFEQEGWRLEKTPNGPMAKGVVLNEMKGAYASNFGHYIGSMEVAAPDTPLKYSFGGHPNAILGLTFEKVKEFHSRYYAPSNSVLVTSGVFDMDVFHNIIDKCIARRPNTTNLDQVMPSPEGFAPSSIEKETLAGTEVRVVTAYGADDTVCDFEWSMRVPGPKTPREDLIDQLLHTIFFGKPNNEIEKIGVKHGLRITSTLSFGDFFHATKDAMLEFGVNQVPVQTWKEMLPVFQKEIWEAIQTTRSKGFSKDEWLNAVANMEDSILPSLDKSAHQENIEFAGSVLWGIDPSRTTQNVSLLADLKQNPLTPEELDVWWRRVLSAAPLVTTFISDKSMPMKWDAVEKARVEDYVISGREFAKSFEEQEKKENGSKSLPCLLEEDIEIKITECEKTFSSETGSSADEMNTAKSSSLHVSHSGQVSSVSTLYDISHLSEDEIIDLSLLSSVSSLLGTKKSTSADFRGRESDLGIKSGVALEFQENAKRESGVVLQVKGASLNKKMGMVVQSVLERMEGCPMFEKKEWLAAFKKARAAFISDTNERANRRAKLESLAPNSHPMAVNLHFLNLKENCVLKKLDAWQKNPEEAHARLDALWDKMLQTSPKFVVSAGTDDLKEESLHLRARTSLASWTNLGDLQSFPLLAPRPSGLELVPSSNAVNFCYRSLKGPLSKESDTAAVKIACALADDYLHEVVREKGGAYDSGITHQNGLIFMSSFRDPNIQETFEAFNGVSEELLRLAKEEDSMKLHEAKLSFLKKFLTPKTPMEKAIGDIGNLSMGLTTLDEKELSENLLKVSWSDIARVATWFGSEQTPTDRACVSETAALTNQDIAQKPKGQGSRP